jgi:hypothetical protein
MAVAVSMASHSVAWRSSSRERMDAVVSRRDSGDPPRWCSPSEWDKKSNKKRAMTVDREIKVYESTATLDFHSSSVCSEIGYLNIGTRGELVSGVAIAAVDKIGSCIVPMTPLWSRKAIGRMEVSPTCRNMSRVSRIARGSMHVACAG